MGATVFSDKTATHDEVERTVGQNAIHNILSNQLSLLPTPLSPISSNSKVRSIGKIILCGSPLLRSYCSDQFTSQYIKAIKDSYSATNEDQVLIRDTVEKHCRQTGFHHILSELAFLEIRVQRWRDPAQHGIVPIALGDDDDMDYLTFLSGTDVRLKSQPDLASLHDLFFKVIKRVYSSDAGYVQKFHDCFHRSYQRVQKEGVASEYDIRLIGSQEIDKTMDDVLRSRESEVRSMR